MSVTKGCEGLGVVEGSDCPFISTIHENTYTVRKNDTSKSSVVEREKNQQNLG